METDISEPIDDLKPDKEIPEYPDKKIIKDGNLGIRVQNIEKSKTEADSLVAKYKGYYSNENFDNSHDAYIYNLVIRVPATDFEKIIDGFEQGNNEILFKNINARDVTDQFIDLEIRLENKQEYLIRYQELLKKAGSVKEILEIEQQIRQLEEEIESVKGRLTYLNNQLTYSTLNLTLRKEKALIYKPQTRNRLLERLKFSLSRGWFAFIDFLLFLFRLWPFLLIFAILYPIPRKWRIRKKKEKPET